MTIGNWIWKIAIVTIIVAFSSCKSNKVERSDIEMGIDSVFINVYEKGAIQDVPYIFFYYEIRNRTEDSIKVNIRRYEFESLRRDKMITVFKRDTLELFGGNLTPNEFIIIPNGIKKVDLNLDTKDLMSLYQRNKGDYKNEQDLLRDISYNSVNFFFWGGKVFSDKGIKRAVVFRNPRDSSVYEWK